MPQNEFIEKCNVSQPTNSERQFRPRYLMVAPVYQCNLSCPHCCVPIEWPDRLDVATALRCLEDAHAYGIKVLGFTGGEPFLYPEFLHALCRRATRQNSASFGAWLPWNLSTLRPSLPA